MVMNEKERWKMTVRNEWHSASTVFLHRLPSLLRLLLSSSPSSKKTSFFNLRPSVMCLPLDELVHTNKMKLWTIYHGKIFPLNELNMCVFFSLSFGVCLFFFVLIFFSLAFILLPSLVSERGWRYMCMRPHIFSHLYQTNFKLRPGATIIYSFKYEMRKSQCDLPTHNLNCIYWSMKMVISNKTCIASQHRTSARNCNIHSSEHEHGWMLNIDIHTFLHILFWCFTPFSHDLFFSSVFSFVCVCSLAEGKCLHQSVQWITTKCEKKTESR